MMQRAKRALNRIVRLSIDISSRLPRRTTAQTYIVVKRQRERFRIHPDHYDDFEFKTGDRLTIRPLHQAASLLKTPDQHQHIRRSDGKAIRVPPSFALFSYRKYQIPERLIVLTGAGSSSWEQIAKGHIANYVHFMSFAPGMTFLENRLRNRP